MSANSHRQILKSSSVIGGASVINIAVNLIKIKIAAIWLGPAGVGVIGLLQSLIATGGLIASLGVGTAGARQVAAAAAHGDVRRWQVRRALLLLSPFVGVLGFIGFLLVGTLFSDAILPERYGVRELTYLAVGVAFAGAAFCQTAVLNGERDVAALAWISVGTAVFSTVIGITALYLWSSNGLIVFVLASPLVSLLLGFVFLRRLRSLARPIASGSGLAAEWKTMASLGLAVMLSSALTPVALIVIRLIIQRSEGADGLGEFQAAWNVSITYIGFVLAAMGTDYFPRLTAVITDPQKASRLVNDQTEVALVLAGPVLLGMIGFAPMVIKILYSSEFTQAAAIFRWQILGDVLKIISWPLGFILLAAGAGKRFVVAELAGSAAYVIFCWQGLPHIGLNATGFGFVVMYAVYLPIVYASARRLIGFRWEPTVLKHASWLLVLATVTLGVATYSDPVGYAFAAVVCIGTCVHSIGRLGSMLELSGRLGSLAALSRRISTKLGM